MIVYHTVFETFRTVYYLLAVPIISAYWTACVFFCLHFYIFYFLAYKCFVDFSLFPLFFSRILERCETQSVAAQMLHASGEREGRRLDR
jgi:hypothetical protein